MQAEVSRNLYTTCKQKSPSHSS